MRLSSMCMRVGLLAVALACLPFIARAQTPDEREQRNIQLREQQRKVELENAKRTMSQPVWARREISRRLPPPPPKRKMTEEHKLRLYPAAEEKVPVRQGTTYVLRSTTYRFGDDLDMRRKLDDVLIAFRVVGTTADGSVTLLWRELRRQKTPKIKP